MMLIIWLDYTNTGDNLTSRFKLSLSPQAAIDVCNSMAG